MKVTHSSTPWREQHFDKNPSIFFLMHLQHKFLYIYTFKQLRNYTICIVLYTAFLYCGHCCTLVHLDIHHNLKLF